MNEIKKLNVIKVPNEIEDDLSGTSKPFPRMPRMYLELLENKSKIKPDLLNRDYDPNEAESVISFYSSKEEDNQPIKENSLEKIEEHSTSEEEGSEEDISVSSKSTEEQISVNSSVSDGKEDDIRSSVSQEKPPSHPDEIFSEKNSEHSFFIRKK